MPTERKLAAIMFTDIAGYTSLMQESEQVAINIRRRHREVFEPVTEKYNGRIIQYYGDGTLSIFESTVQAVKCANELQQNFLQEPAIPVRIGIHTGDILVSETDIIGDSVNLASRVESLGVPGSVLVSGKVAEEIKNQDELPLVLLGKFHFKNDARPREVYALNIPGLVIPDRREMKGKLKVPEGTTRGLLNRWVMVLSAILLFGIIGWGISVWFAGPTIERIAVLPFFNQMNNPEKDPLVAGLHNAILFELQRAGINAIGRTTMMQYQESEKTLTKIADELKADALIEGSVSRADDSIALFIRIYDGKDEDLIAVKLFESAFADVTALYNEVTRNISKEIHKVLQPEVEARLQEHQPVNPEAYKAYIRGQQYWYSLTPSALEAALKYFELSKKMDPEFAPAYAGIAAVWGGRLQQGTIPFSEASPYLMENLTKANNLGTTFAEVQFWNAAGNTWWLWNWKGAGEAFEKSLELNPNYAEAHAYYSHYLLITGQPKNALFHIRTALELDPFNSLFQALYGMALNFTGNYEEVTETLTQTLKESPTDMVAISALRTTYHLTGEFDKALDIWRDYYTIRKDQEALQILKGKSAGSYHDALEELAEMMVRRSETQYVTPWQIATLYTRAGNNEEALNYLEQAFFHHDANMPYIAVDPIFDGLRNEERFKALLLKMGLNQ